jgi:hypothetical protein
MNGRKATIGNQYAIDLEVGRLLDLCCVVPVLQL